MGEEVRISQNRKSPSFLHPRFPAARTRTQDQDQEREEEKKERKRREIIMTRLDCPKEDCKTIVNSLKALYQHLISAHGYEQ
jgi:hypothetical protein